MQLAFPKKSYNKDRKQRRAKRVCKGRVEPESILQVAADKLYKDLGIKTLRIKDSVFTAINTSNLPNWLKIFFNTYLRGWPDNTLLLKNGRYICIELKSEIGTQLPSQKEFQKEVGEDNYYICRTIDDIILVLKDYGVIA